MTHSNLYYGGSIILEKLVIKGGKRLCGEVIISGAKNAAVAIIPAALLVDGICIVENVPAIRDVFVICSILEELGAKITYLDKYTIKIDASCVNKYTAPYEMVRKMRASYYLLGALLGKYKSGGYYTFSSKVSHFTSARKKLAVD